MGWQDILHIRAKFGVDQWDSMGQWVKKPTGPEVNQYLAQPLDSSIRDSVIASNRSSCRLRQREVPAIDPRADGPDVVARPGRWQCWHWRGCHKSGSYQRVYPASRKANRSRLSAVLPYGV